MRDFTCPVFNKLLTTLINEQNIFLSLKDFFKHPTDNFDKKIVLLRHDVDKLPLNSLTLAILEHRFGITGTFYFRIVPESFNKKIIEQVAKLGHEIGYHYEEMDLVYKKIKRLKDYKITRLQEEDLIDEAYELFYKNLNEMRKVEDIKTICMHGSPLSPFDNKAIWKKYNYRELGLIGEPYFDINWNEFAYLTDTGRRWNGNDVSIRDKVQGKFNFSFKSTRDIIDNINMLPDKIMFTIHPQRWTNEPVHWAKELIGQNAKNIVKKYLVTKTLKQPLITTDFKIKD